MAAVVGCRDDVLTRLMKEGRDEALTRLMNEGRDEALTRLTVEDGVGHGNAIASLIETRMVVRAATQCFITCET